MRVCVDTNVLISFLLKPNVESPPVWIIRAAVAEQFNLVLSSTTIQDLLQKIEEKPYLSARIPPEAVSRFVRLLESHSAIAPPLPASTPVPITTRDPKDDYLITHAVLEQVDYLVSGDKDLLVLGSVLGVRIVSPADFALLLRTLDP
jgi:putative PIN family toxin of toxin-antitoxin system